MEWNRLLSSETLAPLEPDPVSWKAYPMDAFEKDYRTIINSSTFRKLQDKTQVMPLNRGDFVRTRLTHSLEVSSLGTQLGKMISNNMKKEEIFRVFEQEDPLIPTYLPTILSCAGLLHDLGNPPFGHVGEENIGSYFRKNLKRDDFCFRGKPIREILTPQMQADLCNFEGNAQVLRILSQARWENREESMNLTFAVINTLIKYPNSSLEISPKDPDVRFHKMGYFLTEEEIFHKVRETAGVPGHSRHPLTFLLEAADDIAYMTSDVEDAVNKGLFTMRQMVQFFQDELKKIPEEGSEFHMLQRISSVSCIETLQRKIRDKYGDEWIEDRNVLHEWAQRMKGYFLYVTVYSFFNHYQEIMDGSYSRELFEDSHHKYTAQILKKLMRTYVYFEKNKLQQDLLGYNIINYFMEAFIPAVINWETNEAENMSLYDRTLIYLIPEEMWENYRTSRTGDDAKDLYLRFRIVIDYISGFTDSGANNLYKKLNGIS